MQVFEGTLRVGGLNITDAGQTRARRVTWHVCITLLVERHDQGAGMGKAV